MWQAIENPFPPGILREITDFGLGKIATVSMQIDANRWLVLAESIDHTDHLRVNWGRMIEELQSGGEVVEAQ